MVTRSKTEQKPEQKWECSQCAKLMIAFEKVTADLGKALEINERVIMLSQKLHDEVMEWRHGDRQRKNDQKTER